VVLKSTPYIQTFYSRSETVDLLLSLILFSTSNPNTNKKPQPDKLNNECKLCNFMIIVRQKIKMIWLALFPLITFATISSCANFCQEEDHTTRPLGRVRLFIRKRLWSNTVTRYRQPNLTRYITPSFPRFSHISLHSSLLFLR
jgi:hypothetical protein